MGGYSTQEVADLIGMKPDQVRHYVRRQLLDPERGTRGEFRFGFRDVVLLRTAKGLLDSKVSSRRAYRVLLKLQEELESVSALSSVRIFADGNTVVVRQDNRLWEAESGQVQLDFTVSELAANVADLAQRNLPISSQRKWKRAA